MIHMNGAMSHMKILKNLIDIASQLILHLSTFEIRFQSAYFFTRHYVVFVYLQLMRTEQLSQINLISS